MKLIHKCRIQIRLAAMLASFALLFSLTSPAEAIDSDCVPAPQLTNSRRTELRNLADGVTASSWRWYAGNDAGRVDLSPLGTQVSVVTGNLRNIDFGILHAPIPQSQDLRMLNFTSYSALGSINGDYMDGNGPWSAMIEDGSMFYAPAGHTGVVGVATVRVNPAKGYRTVGTISIGKRTFRVTGVNQPMPGNSSVVIYKSNYINDVPPKGEATIVVRNGKLYRIYPKGVAVSKRYGTVIQLRGPQAAWVRSLVLNSTVRISLATAPTTENRMAADSVSAFGSISSNTTTLNFVAINYGYLTPYGATLFDENYSEVTKSGKITLRIQPDDQGRLIVKNVYRQGYFTRVDTGGFIVQVSSTLASTALRFKVGDVVTISRSYRATGKSQFINAAGRGPRILQNGRYVWSCSTHSNEYRPRSAIGWNQDGQIWLMTSSRGENVNDNGMRMGGSTTDQMGQWLMQLGATDAVLLDGGGSTTLEMNDPEDGWRRLDLPEGAWYRALANAFALQSRY
ncbi:MAG: phosphodiester glycosidase family protein [Acidobacteria bacterium]|nr:phosphodiester glycosidase family protein [Acidobacteriota bacterium]